MLKVFQTSKIFSKLAIKLSDLHFVIDNSFLICPLGVYIKAPTGNNRYLGNPVVNVIKLFWRKSWFP